MIPTPVMRTPISMKDFARAMILTLRMNGITPTKAACGVLWAQYALETGAGGYCWNHNLFNHKVTRAQVDGGKPYMMLANTWEIINGQKVIFQPPDPATWFRAYASFEAAMSDHITSVKNGRYASSWPAVLAGDALTYAAELRAHGYYTAPLKDYQKLLLAKLVDWDKSTAYDDAMYAVLEAAEEETQPEIQLQNLDAPDFATVTRLPGSIAEDPDDPPDAA